MSGFYWTNMKLCPTIIPDSEMVFRSVEFADYKMFQYTTNKFYDDKCFDLKDGYFSCMEGVVLNKVELYDHLLYLSNKVGLRIRKQNRYAYVVAVIIKDKYFKRKTHQKKLLNPINTSMDIYNISKDILNEMWNEDSVRLIGIRLDNLVENYSYQTSLFEDIKKNTNNEVLDKTLDKLKEKYGDKIIENADLKKKI